MLQLFISLVAIASVSVGVGGGVGYARLGDVAGRAVFVSPYFSAIVVFCGAALYAAQTFPRHARLWALVAMGAIVSARLASQWSDVWLSGRTISANFATVLIVLGASAALFWHRGGPQKPYRASRGDVAVALLGVVASTFISFALIEENITTRQKFAEKSAKAVATDVRDRTARAETLTRRLGDRWSAVRHMPEKAFMEEEFSSYLRDFTFFLSLAIVDDNGSVVLEHSRDTAVRGRIEDLAARHELNDLLSQAHVTGQTRIAVREDAWGDGKTGLLIAPLTNPDMNNWSVVASIDLTGIAAWAMTRTDDGGYFRISHENTVLYRSTDEPPTQAIAAGDIVIPVHDDFKMHLSYVYPPTGSDLDTEVWAEFVWLAGIIFTFLLVASQRLTSVARERSVQLSHNALHDPLTGLPNRRLLEQELMRACVGARRTKRPVSVVFFDLDGIKLINDSIGHDVGDEVLMEVATRLQRSAQKDGSVTHLGAYEFVLLFVGIDPERIRKYTQQVIDDLSRPYHVAGGVLSMTASAGIVTSDGNVRDPMELVRQADLAMLRAKQEGRNTWYTYTEDLSVQVVERLELRRDLQSALDTNALQLHYQPIVEGHSGRVIGVEALLRWSHETHGYVSPARFIPLAEETGQIVALTDWVLATACHDSSLLRMRGLPSFPVIVNISPLYFQRANFVENIQRVLRVAGLPAQFLELEITEGVFLDNEEAAILKLTELRDMGIRTSIDDFGTGYSSLSYLKNLPVDKVKIDRAFIIDAVSDPADAAIVRGIISMAHHLGLTVVAEGVETEPQFAFLRRSYCDAFQGYLFAKPMPFDELLATLGRSGCRLLSSDPLTEPPSQRVLLLVDDEKNILSALTRLLRRDGYHILTAGTPSEAFDLLAKHKVQVIVSDQRMPEMNGTEFFSKVKNMYPETVRMILSGYTDLKSVTEAINHGAIYKFITKPWDDEALREDIENAFKKA